MEKTRFGTLKNGQSVHLYTMKNESLCIGILDYGCRIQHLIFDGRDTVGGYDNLAAYEADGSSQGAFVGRVANRIKNSRFTLNGKTYQLEPNEKENHLHGTFANTVWEAKFEDACTLVLSHTSSADEEGYPGDIDVTVTYQLIDNAVKMTYTAKCDEDTPVNFTNHSYFNIDGIGSGSIMTEEMQILADRYTVVDGDLIPTGERRNVAETAYDFRDFHPINHYAAQVDGYDTNFWLTGEETEMFGTIVLSRAVSLHSSSYRLDCYTDMPCIQIYTANFLGEEPCFKYGIAPKKQHAVCLETQFEPDSVNRGEGILKAGEVGTYTTLYKFTHR